MESRDRSNTGCNQMATDRSKVQYSACDGTDVEPHEFSSPPCLRHELDPGYVDAKKSTPMDWSTVRAWRREQRRRISELRDNTDKLVRMRADLAILEHIDRENVLDNIDTGIYWPLQGEFDSRPLMERVLDIGGRVAIPVIVAPNKPLEFWYWNGRAQMHAQGPWGIPAPAERHIAEPSILFVPLLGFDTDSHRLGHGGGYFDRTLATMSPRPVTIGIGYELGRLDTIFPQGHDIPLDAIVTERKFAWRVS